MTPTRLREILDLLHWSQRSLAVILDLNPTTTARYANGRQPVPPDVADWLERLAKAHADHPAPVRK